MNPKLDIYLIVSATFLALAILAFMVFVDIRNELRKIRKQIETDKIEIPIHEELTGGIKWPTK